MRTRTIIGVLVAGVMTSIGLTGTADAASSIRFGYFHYDSPGSDTGTNKSLNGEYFRLKNYGSKTINLKGWSVRDKVGHTYTIGSNVHLKPGGRVTIHTGTGTNGGGHRYWGQGWYVWNNTGDTATLRGPAGVKKDTCTWTSTGSGYQSC